MTSSLTFDTNNKISGILEVKDELERLMYDVKRTANTVRTNLKGMEVLKLACISYDTVYETTFRLSLYSSQCLMNCKTKRVINNNYILLLHALRNGTKDKPARPGIIL